MNVYVYGWVLGQESIQRKALRVEEFGDWDFFDVLETEDLIYPFKM